MGTLYLVRHGQASFGAADYDNLSELGHRQAVRLGEYWRERGMKFLGCASEVAMMLEKGREITGALRAESAGA